MKIKWLDRQALPPLPYYCLCTKQKEFQAVMRHLKVPKPYPEWITKGAGATTHFMVHPEGHIVAAVCMAKRNGCDKAQHLALLAHEAVHIWQTYAEDVLRESKPSHELEAYAVQSITQALITRWLKVSK